MRHGTEPVTGAVKPAEARVGSRPNARAAVPRQLRVVTAEIGLGRPGYRAAPTTLGVDSRSSRLDHCSPRSRCYWRLDAPFVARAAGLDARARRARCSAWPPACGRRCASSARARDGAQAAVRQASFEAASRSSIPTTSLDHALAGSRRVPGVDARARDARRRAGDRGVTRRVGPLGRGSGAQRDSRCREQSLRARRGRLPLPARGRGRRARPLRCRARRPARAGDRALGSLAALQPLERPAASIGAVDELESRRRGAEPALGTRAASPRRAQLAELDSLTGLHNRRSSTSSLEREVARAHRYARRLSLLVLDLDDFKLINDTAGHLAADAVLAELGPAASARLVRTTDIPCRFGGDEFGGDPPRSRSRGGRRARSPKRSMRAERLAEPETVDERRRRRPICPPPGVADRLLRRDLPGGRR